MTNRYALLAGVTVALAVVLAAGVAPLVAMVAGAGLGSAVLAVHVATGPTGSPA